MPVSGLTFSPGDLSLVHMAWVTAMATMRDCLILAQITSFLSPIPGFKHKFIHKTTWFRNGNHSKPGHIIDYILVNRCFQIIHTWHPCVPVSTPWIWSWATVVSTLRFKIKNKHCQSTVPRQTTNLRADIKSDFRTHLSDAFSHIPNDTSIESC